MADSHDNRVTADPTDAQRAERRAAHAAHADGFSRGMELVLTPCVIAAMGYGLDRLLGTGPFLVVLFAVLGVGGAGLRAWYHYDAEMKVAEAAFAGRTGVGRTGTALPVRPSEKRRKAERLETERLQADRAAMDEAGRAA